MFSHKHRTNTFNINSTIKSLYYVYQKKNDYLTPNDVSCHFSIPKTHKTLSGVKRTLIRPLSIRGNW